MDAPRNFIAYTGDIMAFMVGLNFIPTATVLVALASQLTGNPTLIGLVGTIGSVAWFLPQLFAARIVHGKRRKKPYLLASALIGRQAYLVFAIWLLATHAATPLLTYGILVLCIFTFHITDALAGVAWFDMLSRALTPRMRSRSIATGEFIGSIFSIGAGIIVARILTPDGLTFPQNYALIILCAWACFNVSSVFLLLIRENPMDEAERSQSTEAHFGAHLKELLASDKTFRKALLARLLTGLDIMAVPFYVVFIRNLLQLPETSVGTLTIAYTVGGIAGIVLFGGLADRFGSLRVIQASVMLQLVGPLLAFLVAFFPGLAAGAPDAAFALFAVIMAVNGALTHSLLLGFVGYALDSSPERHRAIYVGVINTVGGVVSLAPIAAGALIDWVARSSSLNAGYAIVFGLAAVCVGTGITISLRLPRPRLSPGAGSASTEYNQAGDHT